MHTLKKNKSTDNRNYYKVEGCRIINININTLTPPIDEILWFAIKNSPTVVNNRILNNQLDVTDEVIKSLEKYKQFDFTGIPELAFLGKKG